MTLGQKKRKGTDSFALRESSGVGAFSGEYEWSGKKAYRVLSTQKGSSAKKK